MNVPKTKGELRNNLEFSLLNTFVALSHKTFFLAMCKKSIFSLRKIKHFKVTLSR